MIFIIKTQAEYQSALDYIDQDLELYDFELSKKMTSYEYNIYLQDIEYYLDILYEKTRVVEDLIDHLENYNLQKTSALITTIQERQGKLQESVDKYISRKSKAYDVTWDIGGLDSIKDRDGSELQKAVMYSGIENYLGFGSSKKSKLEIKSIVKESTEPSYSDNISTCLNDGYYITSYNLEYPTVIKETLHLELNSPENARFFHLKPINCEVEHLGTDESGRDIYVLTNNNMIKTNENFVYKNYIGSQLEATGAENSFVYNIAKDINQNQNEKINLKNSAVPIEYYNKVLNYQSVANTQKDNSSSLSIYQENS